MSEQFFTDDKMFLLALTFFVLMLGVGTLLVTWRDWDVLWVFAVEVLQIMPILYFFNAWARQTSPLALFPEVNLLIRPYTVSLWLLMLIYAAVRLRAKQRAKHGISQWD